MSDSFKAMRSHVIYYTFLSGLRMPDNVTLENAKARLVRSDLQETDVWPFFEKLLLEEISPENLERYATNILKVVVYDFPYSLKALPNSTVLHKGNQVRVTLKRPVPVANLPSWVRDFVIPLSRKSQNVLRFGNVRLNLLSSTDNRQEIIFDGDEEGFSTGHSNLVETADFLDLNGALHALEDTSLKETEFVVFPDGRYFQIGKKTVLIE